MGCFAATARGWGCTGQGVCVLHEIPHLGECARPSSSGPRPLCSTRQAPPGGLWAAKTATSRLSWSKTDPEATCFAHESPPVCDDVVSHPKYPGALVMGNSRGRCEAIWLWASRSMPLVRPAAISPFQMRACRTREILDRDIGLAVPRQR